MHGYFAQTSFIYPYFRDLANEFAKSPDAADEVILLPIYLAREGFLEGVTSEIIKENMMNRECENSRKRKDVLMQIRNNELLITAGAGDIDTLVEPIKLLLGGSK